MVAKQTTAVDANHARKVLRMIDLLEDSDDVQRVTTNADFPEEILDEFGG
jgi:transcriptional/translational regulatory protein YebC/TACO1